MDTLVASGPVADVAKTPRIPTSRATAWPGVDQAGSRVAVSISGLRRAYRRAAADAGLPKDLLVKGPHDLRHTFSTWLEDAGIPARVIDDVMGHPAGWRGESNGSVVGVGYRHTTPAMEQRVRAAIQKRREAAVKAAHKPEVSEEIQRNRVERLRLTAR